MSRAKAELCSDKTWSVGPSRFQERYGEEGLAVEAGTWPRKWASRVNLSFGFGNVIPPWKQGPGRGKGLVGQPADHIIHHHAGGREKCSRFNNFFPRPPTLRRQQQQQERINKGRQAASRKGTAFPRPRHGGSGPLRSSRPRLRSGALGKAGAAHVCRRTSTSCTEQRTQISVTPLQQPPKIRALDPCVGEGRVVNLRASWCLVFDFVDLTVPRRKFEGFSDDEDEEEFGSIYMLTKLYARDIWRLKHNDESLAMLTLAGHYVDRHGSIVPCYPNLSEGICRRIGKHMCGSKYIRSITIYKCGINERKMNHLFGPNAPQFEANEFVEKSDLLQRIGLVEQLMRENVMEYVNVFPRLEKVVISGNPIGIGGLQVLVKALGGTPIRRLDIVCCELESVVGVKELRHCKELSALDISGNCVRNDVEEIGAILDCDNRLPSLVRAPHAPLQDRR
ncbi:hypothetical protein THAOC_36853 [Thalassiosira oceanica]|uniref:Uncharacterized protein n=1 Tax=Thalassiosira oceanica TaxID=159749 RepID=K0R7D9_THAOC|nr:hypothetical protein THAOC_36853 [Thalassiosira oceanica]|eukprot:EJK44596.1 hypothetical protein THAOC_36853 [Thalassiosira oceanica]